MPDISHVTDAIDRYVQNGTPTGSCTEAILSGDLFDAFARADDDTKQGMAQIVRYIFNRVPTGCWGSRETYQAWVERGGLNGHGATHG